MATSLRNNKPKEAEDLGFGTRITGANQRLFNKKGGLNVERRGNKVVWTPYQDLVETSWRNFFLSAVGFFVGSNLLFALALTYIGTDCLSGVQAGSGWIHHFSQAWFFSVQTFTTVGYGTLSPSCTSTNFMAALIALSGVLSFSIMTGLLFARFSKPTSQLIFSNHALIAPYKDGKSFQFRIVNRRSNSLINVEAKLTVSWVEEDEHGLKKRRFARAPIELDKVMMLSLNWNIVHPIDMHSPLYGKGAADFHQMELEVIALIEGYDETFSQTVHANYSYTSEEIICNARFKPMYFPGENGRTVLDLDLLDEVIPTGE